ncbi:hypothetical protein CDAR_470311 [Caerostris darwini]|uniref:Protein Skeletor n=1 Tax=Caerostris darwini TaxID=1538125 RepID=A0AAV4PPN6_9ARAC|nr:hypothetical protein CDAR_470311 [Caerostris darwini]
MQKTSWRCFFSPNVAQKSKLVNKSVIAPVASSVVILPQLKKMLLLLLFAFVGSGLGTRPYYGAKVGEFTTYFHDVRGDVFAVNDKTLFIENFNYDGKGADAVFWVGGTTEPDSTGFMVHVGQDSEETLGPSKDQSLILHLPAGIKITDLRWLSVWSRKFSISFGSVIFPKIVAPPRPTVIGPLNNTREGVSSGDVLVIDSQTFFIPNFNYDGSGQNVRWWASKESKTNLEDLPLYDEGGRDLPLQQYQNETVIISLPDGYSVFDYRFLSLWSSSENENYGSVEIPSDLNIPPSPRILDLVTEREVNKFNCEMLNDNLGLQVRWLIKGNGIIIHLVGNIEHSEYMALGFSKDDTETKFDGADAAITWLDKDGKGHVADYYLENTEICENGHGMCPDDTYEGSGNNLILLSAKKFNGTTTITFKRPLKAEDKLYDQNIYTDGPQAVLWAIGSIQDGNLVASPTLYAPKETFFLTSDVIRIGTVHH